VPRRGTVSSAVKSSSESETISALVLRIAIAAGADASSVPTRMPRATPAGSDDACSTRLRARRS